MAHWTEDLFQNYPDLFLKMLEKRIDDAKCEVDLLLRYLSEQGFKPQYILDLNCGIGRHSIELGRKGINVLGTDLSPRYIEIAKERAKIEGVEGKVCFKIADMRRIASTLLEEEPFDGIVSLDTSFGFYDDETNADILRQCADLVRPSGFFVLEIVNRDWIVPNFQERGFSRYEGVILLEDREFDVKTSRMRSTWTYLVQRNNKHFILEKQIILDHRIWSLHELVELFGKNSWEFKEVYPGFGKWQTNSPMIQAHRLLFIGKKKNTIPKQ